MGEDYPYNVRLTVNGVDFLGPGFEDEIMARAIKGNASQLDGVQNAEVVRNE